MKKNIISIKRKFENDTTLLMDMFAFFIFMESITRLDIVFALITQIYKNNLVIPIFITFIIVILIIIVFIVRNIIKRIFLEQDNNPLPYTQTIYSEKPDDKFDYDIDISNQNIPTLRRKLNLLEDNNILSKKEHDRIIKLLDQFDK